MTAMKEGCQPQKMVGIERECRAESKGLFSDARTLRPAGTGSPSCGKKRRNSDKIRREDADSLIQQAQPLRQDKLGMR